MKFFLLLFVDLALKIAQEFGFLIYSRNWNSLTPLQVMVTVPNVFQSSELGPTESLIYSGPALFSYS